MSSGRLPIFEGGEQKMKRQITTFAKEKTKRMLFGRLPIFEEGEQKMKRQITTFAHSKTYNDIDDMALPQVLLLLLREKKIKIEKVIALHNRMTHT